MGRGVSGDAAGPLAGSLRLLAGTGGPVGVTVDGRSVPLSAVDAARFRWGLAPAGLATRRQLSALGLRPAGHPPVARIECRRGRRWADLYRLDTAAPKLPLTAGRRRALAAALAARRRCPGCGLDAGYVIPGSLGVCVPCHDRPEGATATRGPASEVTAWHEAA